MRTVLRGQPTWHWATETIVDEICEAQGICPVEFRLKNAVKEGDERVDGVTYPPSGCGRRSKRSS
ncbi:MAG: hypothetical protein CM1200mP2_40200 [Planctomycetaceae bacterium]|nr:MAG: hypothetical protein CM1200mP2_40200 [Planctomycetaceae bacterium]